MSKKLILFLMVLLFGSANFLRADEVTIGDLENAVSDTYLPMNSLYNYSYTQQIYTAEEIGTGGTINAITVWMYGNENLYEMPFNIYMMEVEKDEFDSTTDWVVVTEADMVYTGTVTVHNATAEPYTFTLDVPFEYSGMGNLMIAFNNTTGQWKGGLNAMVFGTTEDPARSIYARRDTGAYDPYDPTFTATSLSYRKNVLTLTMGGVTPPTPPTPPAPEEWNPDTNVELTTLELLSPEHMAQNVANPVLLTWNTDTNAVEYKVEFGTTYPPATVIDWDTITVDNVNFYYPGVLDVNTRYFWRVSIRNATNTLTSPLYNFVTTMNVPTQVQLTETEIFEDETTTVKWKGASPGGGGGGFTGEITVADGTATSSYVPVYGLWADYYTRSEMIYPAEMLEEMNGGAITSLKYYLSSPATGLWSPDIFQVYLMEVDATTLSSYYTSADAQIVYTGELDGTGSEMTIEFETPYIYNGGNLLIGIEEIVNGTYKSASFYGVAATGASASGYNSSSLAGVTFYTRDFLPKVTITCGGKKGGDRSLVGYNVYVNDEKVNENVITTLSYEISDLEYNMEGYEVNVTAVYNEGESNYNEGENILYVSGTGSISGVVTNLMTGETMAGVAIAFQGHDEFGNNVSYSATTDDNGAYTIENVKVGTYPTGRASLETYEPNVIAEPAVVVYDETTEVNFTLHEVYYPVAGVVAEDLEALAMVKWSMGDINVGPNPGPGGGGASLSEGFENGLPTGWNVIDANNDGYTWCLTSAIPTTWTYYATMTLDWYRTGTNAICSGSYINGVGALTPDEYLVTPQMTISNGTTFSFWAAATDASYPADHFGVFVSDNGTSNWTSVQEWTLTAKEGANGGRASRDGNGAKLGTWYQYSVDLSAYAGSKYIAIRHFNCNDQYIMCVDDIEMTGSKGDRSVNYYTLYKKTLLKENMTEQDSVMLEDYLTDTLYADVTWASTVPGLYQYGVSAVYPMPDNGDKAMMTTTIDFETGDFSQYNFDNTSTYPWVITSDNSYTGTYCMKSSNGGISSSTSQISAVVTYPSDGTLSFAALCMGEGTSTIWDKCIFELDGVEKFCYGANMPGWNVYEYDIPEGDHTMVWKYSKDGSVNPTGDYMMVDDIQFTYDAGGNDNPITPVVWSNVLPKNMETTVTVNAIVNTGSIEGATLTMVNTYSNSIAYTATFDETGTVSFEEFYKGNYAVTVALDGYTSNYNETEVSIWDATTLNAVLAEALEPVATLLVSNTGFARWNQVIPEDGKVAMSYNILLDNVFIAQVTDNFYIFSGLEEGETYTAAVAVNYTTGMSAYTQTTFTYLGCESVETQVEELAGEAQGMDIVLTWNGGTPTPPTPPTPPVGGDTYDFESGMQGWTNIDADGDGNVWAMGTDSGHNSSGYVTSESYINYVGALTPDNYLVSPGAIAAQAGAAVTFWANAQDASYPSEHFGLAVSTSGNTSASDFTTIQEWTMTAKATGEKKERGMNAQGTWYQYTVDLSAYAGQNIYVAIRHFNCTDWFRLNVDDITLSDGSEKSIANAGYGFGEAAGNFTRDWYFYDNGTNDDAIGLTAGGGFYWGIMFPAGTYTGNTLKKVAYFDYTAHTGQFMIYQGGTSAPGTLIYTQDYSVSGTQEYIEIDMTEPVSLDESQNVWVIMHNNNGQYVAAIDNSAGVNYGSCISTDGSTWYTMVNQASSSLDGNWNLRAFIENGGGSTTTALQPNKFNIFVDGELYGATAGNSFTITATDYEEHLYTIVFIDADYNISCEAEVTVAAVEVCDPVTNLTATYYVQNGTAGELISWNAPAGAVSYNIYQMIEGEAYLIAGNWTATSVFLSGIDESGTYVIGISAVYANDCESAIETVEFVWNLSVDENAIVSAIYPNPTSGDLHINATAMTQISVYNAMGQMVYNQNVNADEMVLNMGQFEAGVYMVRIDTENGSSVKRITVVK